MNKIFHYFKFFLALYIIAMMTDAVMAVDWRHWYAYDEPSTFQENLQDIHPGMMVLVNENQNNSTTLTVMDKDNYPIIKKDLPLKKIYQPLIDKDGTLTISGRTDKEEDAIIHIQSNGDLDIKKADTFGLQSIDSVFPASDGGLYIFGRCSGTPWDISNPIFKILPENLWSASWVFIKVQSGEVVQAHTTRLIRVNDLIENVNGALFLAGIDNVHNTSQAIIRDKEPSSEYSFTQYALSPHGILYSFKPEVIRGVYSGNTIVEHTEKNKVITKIIPVLDVRYAKFSPRGYLYVSSNVGNSFFRITKDSVKQLDATAIGRFILLDFLLSSKGAFYGLVQSKYDFRQTIVKIKNNILKDMLPQNLKIKSALTHSSYKISAVYSSYDETLYVPVMNKKKEEHVAAIKENGAINLLDATSAYTLEGGSFSITHLLNEKSSIFNEKSIDVIAFKNLYKELKSFKLELFQKGDGMYFL